VGTSDESFTGIQLDLIGKQISVYTDCDKQWILENGGKVAPTDLIPMVLPELLVPVLLKESTESWVTYFRRIELVCKKILDSQMEGIIELVSDLKQEDGEPDFKFAIRQLDGLISGLQYGLLGESVVETVVASNPLLALSSHLKGFKDLGKFASWNLQINFKRRMMARGTNKKTMQGSTYYMPLQQLNDEFPMVNVDLEALEETGYVFINTPLGLKFTMEEE